MKCSLNFFYLFWGAPKKYLAIIICPILITGLVLIFDINRPIYQAKSIVTMNEQIMIDLRVLTTYIKTENSFLIDGCEKIKTNNFMDFKAQVLPYSIKGELIVESRDLNIAVEALNFWHTCSVNVFKRTIQPYEFELNNLATLRKRINLKSIDLKDINEYYKFRQSILNYELMDSYIKQPILYSTEKIDLNFIKYLTIYLVSLVGLIVFLFLTYPLRK